MSDENNELLQCFLDECTDLMGSIHSCLDSINPDDVSKEVMDTLFRSIHTIKGGSSMFSFQNVTRLSHELENLLSDFRTKLSLGPLKLSLEQMSHIRTEVEKIEQLLKHNDQFKIESQNNKSDLIDLKIAEKSNSSEMLRVPLNNVNSLLDNIWEVFLIRNQLAYLVEQHRTQFESSNLSFIQSFEALDSVLKRNINEIENKTMSMRMSTVSGVFQRMKKAINDYSIKTGKAIELKTSGDHIELDKKVIDMLAEPLIHLVRNAIDHGIEDSSDQRIKKGKTPHGNVLLKAGIDGTRAFIQVSDDGHGIDPQKILASAQKKGLDTSQVKSDQEAIDLIFQPGFSTSAEVTDISGRGVGMDAVKTSIESVGGKIDIKTEVGTGSTFSISIPTGMSVVQAIEVKINNFTYALDSSQIMFAKKIRCDELKENGDKVYFQYDKKYVEVIPVNRVFENYDSSNQIDQKDMALCLVSVFGQTYAALVGDILQTSTLVTKPLSKNGGVHPYLSSVSLLQSGQPIFVLAIDKIILDYIKLSQSENLNGKSA